MNKVKIRLGVDERETTDWQDYITKKQIEMQPELIRPKEEDKEEDAEEVAEQAPFGEKTVGINSDCPRND